MSMVQLHNDKLTVLISTKGAELQSVVDENSVERLWQGDPAFWKGRAPILFPMGGAFLDNGYELDGQWYEMAKHGFARFEEWTVEEAEPTRATLLLNKPNPGFPFQYEFRARFILGENRLRVEYNVKNTDSRVFWYSVGAHEAYAIPGGVDQYELHFDEKETLATYRQQDNNYLKHNPELIAENTDVLKLSTALLEECALVFKDLHSTGVTLQSREHNRKVRVDFAGNKTLMFWQLPHAEYLCIEPWNNSPDFVDGDRRIDHKPDFIRLAPGESETRTHTITFE